MNLCYFSKRMLPDDCMKHPWIVQGREKAKRIRASSSSVSEDRKLDIGKFRSYYRNRKFRVILSTLCYRRVLIYREQPFDKNFISLVNFYINEKHFCILIIYTFLKFNSSMFLFLKCCNYVDILIKQYFSGLSLVYYLSTQWRG